MNNSTPSFLTSMPEDERSVHAEYIAAKAEADRAATALRMAESQFKCAREEDSAARERLAKACDALTGEVAKNKPSTR